MDCLWCGRSLWCRGLFDATALLIKMLNLKLIYSYTSTWPVPSSTILSCAATSGWACINEASNFSCVTWAKENMMIKQCYKDTVIRSNLYLCWFSFKIWRLFCYMCVCFFPLLWIHSYTYRSFLLCSLFPDLESGLSQSTSGTAAWRELTLPHHSLSPHL